MPIKINATTRALVIQKWLEGVPRDTIAKECGLSGGAVSAIIARWKYLEGFELADQLRVLSVALRKCGLSVVELADTLRLKNIMNQLGIDEESTTEFLSETYNASKGLGIQPRQIARYLGDLVAFSFTNGRNIEKTEIKSLEATEDLTAGRRKEVEREELISEGGIEEEDRFSTKQILFFSQLPEYMANLREEKVKLHNDIGELRRKRSSVADQYTLLKYNKDELLKSHDMVEEQLKWYEEIKSELRKFGLTVDVIPQFVKSVRWIQEAGYPVAAITANFSSYAELHQSSETLELEISRKERRLNELDQQITFLEELAQKHSLAIKESDDLKKMGFGYKELKRLRHTIEEIAEANKTINNVTIVENSPEAANNYVVNKFLRDIEDDYDDILGFKQTKAQLENQIQNLTLLRKQQQQAINAIPHLRDSIVSLFQKGITEDQILDLMVHLNKYPSIIDSISKANIGGILSQNSSSTEFNNNESEQGSSDSGTNNYSEFMTSLTSGPKNIIRDSNSLEIPLPIANVSASGFEGRNFPNNVLDGNFETYWSNKERGSWLMLDLGANKGIQVIKIAWYQGDIYDYYFEIFLSDDDKNFKSVKNSCSGGYTSSILEYSLEQGSQARYIKIEVKGNNYNTFAGISEVEVTGSHLQ